MKKAGAVSGEFDPVHVGQEAHALPQTVVRPWGKFETHAAFQTSCLKTLHINPGSRLSLQSHKHRDETWLLLLGDAQATTGPDLQHLTVTELEAGVPCKVPVGALHRLASREGGVIAEIAYGKFDENDITRYEDDYGRI